MIKLQIQTHSSCFTCTHELQNRKKESLSLQLSSHEPCNDKQQNDQKFLAIQPQWKKIATATTADTATATTNVMIDIQEP